MRYASGDFLLPPVDISFCLYLFLDVIRKFGEEIIAGDALHFIYRIYEFRLLSAFLRLVTADKADGLRILARMKNHLEEGIRHYHLVLTQLAMLLIQKYRSADYINLAILLRPVAALLLYRVPYPRIQTVVLRTHIGHQETFVHRLLTPFVVTSRTHVSPIETRIEIICLRTLR